MADDDGWASWKPTTSTAAAATEAFENRKALSRSGSAPLTANAALATNKKHLAPGALAFENAFTPEATPAPGWGNRGQKRGRSRSPPPSARDGGRAGPSRFSDRQEEGPPRPPAPGAGRDDRSPRRTREADRDRRERPVDRERDNRDSRDVRRSDRDRERERERPRERSRDRERDRDHRAAGRDSGHSDRPRDSRRDDVRPPPRALSRERRDARPEDRRDSDVRSIAPRQEARDVKPDARAVASAKTNDARNVIDARDVKRVVTDLAAQVPAPQQSGRQEVSKTPQATATASASVTAFNFGSIKGAASGRTVLVKNLADGTTEGDIEATFAECGKISSCKESKELRKQNILAFEITYVNANDTDRAIREFNGIEADGKVIEVSHYTSPFPASAPSAPVTTTVAPAAVAATQTGNGNHAAIESPLKTSTSDRSLLSRLSGVPASATEGPKSAKSRNKNVNGNNSAEVVSSGLLAPFDELLKRAGVDSLTTLRKLVRPGTAKEYVEVLSQEYPKEPLLEGLTAKWALRERLEEWLGEKQRSVMEWGSRP